LQFWNYTDGKKMTKKRLIILSLAMSFCFPAFIFAETIVLKSGKTVEGKLIEKTDKYIKIDFMDVPLTYFFDEIESIDGKQVMNTKEEPYSRKETIPQDIESTSTSGPKEESAIRVQLKKLGYPEDSWPSIEKELNNLLTKINFEHLKNEVALAKSDPSKLQQLFADLGVLLGEMGYLDTQSPRPLIKLLVNSLGHEDILEQIEDSSIKLEEKNEYKNLLVACTALSQLGYITLDLLGLEVKVADTPNHFFNCIFFDDKEVLFVDFLNLIFIIVDIEEYYKVEGKYMVLKEEYRVPPERLLQMKRQSSVRGGLFGIAKDEILQVFYFSFRINDYCAATPGIYSNLGCVYGKAGNFDQSIYYFTKAIGINPNCALTYYNRGIIYEEGWGDYTQAISDYTKSIEINPYDERAYRNRGILYYNQGDSSQAISDFTKAVKIDPNSADTYYNRGIVYQHQDNFSQAISDYNKAIEINPNYTEAYNNRALANYSTKEYDKAWADVHKAEELGEVVNPEFLNELKEASGRDK